MFCISDNHCPSDAKEQNRNTVFSHNRFCYSGNEKQILLQPDIGAFHFWVSLHLHVIHTLKMYILSLNQFI